MRILFITNYYPPSDQGWGYMQLCEEVADGLAARGHDIAVLTSTRRDGPEIERPYTVHRLLSIDPDWQSERTAAHQFFFGRRKREREAVQALQRLAADFQPDIIFVWHAIGLSRVMLQAGEQTATTVYYLAGYLPELPDEYISYWHAQPVRKTARVFKRPLAKLALSVLRHEGKPVRLGYHHVICVSNYVRERLLQGGLIPSTAVVIHNGIDLTAFGSRNKRNRFDDSISLLYAGRLEADKGIHEILESLRILTPAVRKKLCTLKIVGSGDTEYVARLQAIVNNYELAGIVRFSPPVSRERVPELLDEHDVLILPSALEALSRMMQEAMAMGLLVIGTTTGGSGELLVHEQTGLAFEPGDARSLASQIERAATDRDLAVRLARAGQERVRSSFVIDRTIENIETYLRRLTE